MLKAPTPKKRPRDVKAESGSQRMKSLRNGRSRAKQDQIWGLNQKYLRFELKNK